MLKKRDKFKEVAKERISYLLDQILNTKDKIFAENCAKMIRKLSLRYNVRLNKEDKLTFCQETNSEKDRIISGPKTICESKLVFCKSCFAPFHLVKPKIRIKTIKKNKIDYIQKKILCTNCENILTINYKKEN